MDAFLIKGGVPLHGEVEISGAKNAVLPILAATLLTPETCVVRRVPNLSDVHFMGKILASLGAKVTTGCPASLAAMVASKRWPLAWLISALNRVASPSLATKAPSPMPMFWIVIESAACARASW